MAKPARSASYRPRLVDGRLRELLKAVPAVAITGPRAAGKTTTARQHAASEVRLDQPLRAEAFRADPDAALSGRAEPVLLDEWHEVPAVLGAVKRAIDDDPRPGRFILTGSVRAELEQDAWPGTGRLVRIQMYGFTQRELRADGPRPERPGFLDRLARSDPADFARPTVIPDLRGYIELAVRGGLPLVALSASSAAPALLDDYVDQLLTRDVSTTIRDRDTVRLARYFDVLAASSAGIPEHKTLYDAAAIDRRTALAYDTLLESLFIVESVPAWSDNRLQTLTHTPKRYVVDSSLMAAALSATTETIIDDGDLLGRTLDTFVTAQLRSELAVSGTRARRSHLRTKGGREEVDIVIELPGRRVFAFEVKAGGAIGTNDAKHLFWLRDRLGERFVGGAVLHTGPDPYQLGERVMALPLWALWAD
jgi:predicted AAA+ superfamily ATPase